MISEKSAAEGVFEQVGAASKVARLFAIGHYGADARRSVEGGNAGATRPNPFGQSALGNQRDVDFSSDHLRFQQLVFAHVAANKGSDHAGFEHETQPESIDAHVVADDAQMAHAPAHHGRDQVFRNAAQPESAQHDGGAVGNVGDRLVARWNDFVDCHDLDEFVEFARAD